MLVKGGIDIEKQKFFIDFDDTLVNSSKRFYELYRQIYEYDPYFKSAKYEDNLEWNYSTICPLLALYNEYTVEDLFGMKEFFDGLELFQNAYEVTKELTKRYELYVVTIGSINNIIYKLEYIRNTLPFIENIIPIYNKNCTMNKSIINCPEDSIFLDDVTTNLDSVNSRHKFIYGVPKPWNTEGNQYNRLCNYVDVANKFLR